MIHDLTALPLVELSDEAIWQGQMPALLATAAQAHGPLLRRVAHQEGQDVELLFLVGPEANRFVLHTHREHFSHALGWTPILGPEMGVGLLNMDPPEHTWHRQQWNPSFGQVAMEAYVPVMQQVIAARTARWHERGTVDLYEEAREITFDIAAAALAGFEPGPQTDRLRELFFTMMHGFNPEKESWEAFQTRLTAVRAELMGTLIALIVQRRQEPAAQGRDVLSAIAHARDEEGQPLDEAQILGHLNILLIAGHETTTTLGAWVLRLLATEREQATRVEAELAEVLGMEEGLIPVDGLRRLKVLDAFIREAGRLYPPVLTVPRGVLSDVEFAGHCIPAGSQVRLALAASHHLPSLFAEPERFDPERFAPPRSEDKATPYALVTFGGGPRICIGLNFAYLEVKVLVAHVLRHFRLVAEGPPPAHAGYWTAVIPGGMPIRVEARP